MTPDQLADLLRAAGWGAYVPAALAFIGLAAKLAAILPQPPPQSPHWLRIARTVLDVIAGNWGNARNALPATIQGTKP